MEDEWEDAALLVLGLAVAGVDKHVGFPAVAVHVAEERDFPFLLQTKDEFLGRVDGRVQLLRRGFPSPVEVAASQTAPVIAIDYPVWVQHRDDLKNKVLSQQF